MRSVANISARSQFPSGELQLWELRDCEETNAIFHARAKARSTNLAPRSARGSEVPREARPRRRPLQNLALNKHFVVAAYAATKLCRAGFPRAERGAKLVKRAFARHRGTPVLRPPAFPYSALGTTAYA
jgi:hypothetical protein